ncbi:MAG: hypothetical protein PHX35_01840 [Candidatus Bipolaricaulis anaerobius]|nr:hypothetical protein [Candidatus Bipolaricaulis anaerobius]
MQRDVAPDAVGEAPVGLALAVEQARELVGYEQPSADLVSAISVVYTEEDKDASLIPASSKGLDILVVGHVPFYRYWQDDEQRYVFHPMAYGRFLGRLSCNEDPELYLAAAVSVAHSLPNGGLLWYYPDNYRLNRMLGPDLHPSCIGQGQILGAITQLDARCNGDFSELARGAYLGLSFDYHSGGVNLENKALLEIPLFRSCPEIILNGWLHALLHLHNYVEHYQDREAKELLAANVAYLVEHLERFHDDNTGLSRYSDLTPYRVRVQYETESSPNLIAFYRSRDRELEDYRISLEGIDHESRSPFDNQIITQGQGFTDIWISCSQAFDTYVVSTTGPFTVTFDAGVYSPYTATPRAGGKGIELHSYCDDGYHVVHITDVREELFCGYPTNFSKVGANYYHPYHVVALACLLAGPEMPDEVAMKLRSWMERWLEAVENPPPEEGLEFVPFSDVLGDLVKHELFTITDDWETLLAMARASAR